MLQKALKVTKVIKVQLDQAVTLVLKALKVLKVIKVDKDRPVMLL
jgi:hypothetical protein